VKGTLLYLAINAAQHSMIWIGNAQMLAPSGVNRIGSYMGVMGQSPFDPSGAAVTIEKGDYLR
jgi:NAD(P)H dehydrogenase (quinone)